MAQPFFGMGALYILIVTFYNTHGSAIFWDGALYNSNVTRFSSVIVWGRSPSQSYIVKSYLVKRPLETFSTLASVERVFPLTGWGGGGHGRDDALCLTASA